MPLPLAGHLNSAPVFGEVRCTRSLVLYVCFVDHCLSFVLFLLAIVLSVLLRYTDCDYPFDIVKFFLHLWTSALQIVSCMLYAICTYYPLCIIWSIGLSMPLRWTITFHSSVCCNREDDLDCCTVHVVFPGIYPD